MKTRRFIINIIMALTLVVSAGAFASAPAYAAKTKSGSKTTAKSGGSGGGSGGGGSASGGGGSGGGGSGGSSSACPSNQTAKGQVLQGLGQTGSNCDDSQVNRTIKTVVTILSLIVGIASVIVIIIGGFKYIVSGGDQNRVAGAKSTLLYALVGLGVAGLAQLLIHFVLYQTNK